MSGCLQRDNREKVLFLSLEQLLSCVRKNMSNAYNVLCTTILEVEAASQVPKYEFGTQRRNAPRGEYRFT